MYGHEEEKAKGFLEEVRSLDESIKKKILIGVTAVVMVGVVYVWLGYFNNIIASVPTEAVAAPDDSSSTAVAVVEPGFFERVGGGSAYIAAEVGGWVSRLAKVIQSPKQYVIKP